MDLNHPSQPRPVSPDPGKYFDAHPDTQFRFTQQAHPTPTELSAARERYIAAAKRTTVTDAGITQLTK